MKGIILLTAALLAAGCSGLMGSLKDHQANHKGLSTMCFRGLAVPYGRVILSHVHLDKGLAGAAEIGADCSMKVNHQ